VGKPVGKRLLLRLHCRLEDDIIVGLQKVGWWHGLGLCGSGEGQVGDFCEGGNESPIYIECVEFLDYLRPY
jgi:hypothetical protein